ncbi:MAG: VWA domain-containing protein [Candidatus Hydrogenedentes bacterium]|nr:VWA domain-containing protein [Candidatus Hydrogenedentota bacterium]
MPHESASDLPRLIPQAMTQWPFGKVYVRRDGDRLRVDFTIWLDTELEGWQTGIALDASMSMKPLYGRMPQGRLPARVMHEYVARGWAKTEIADGCEVPILNDSALADALGNDYLRYGDNEVEPLARDFIAYLAEGLDLDNHCTVIYWGCGDGAEYEVMGDIMASACRSLVIAGPERAGFGEATHLAPAIRYFLDRFARARRGLFIFLTDGHIDDVDAVRTLSERLAQEILEKKRQPLKFVLIGLGHDIDEESMLALDHLNFETKVDLWDHKIASELRALSEIMVEIVDANQIVAPSAIFYDHTGRVVAEFPKGLPARTSILLPLNARGFEIELRGRRFAQPLI